MDEVLTVEEVVGLLKVSRLTVFRMLKRGEFPGAFKVGDGVTAPWRIPAADLQKLRERHAVNAWTPEKL